MKIFFTLVYTLLLFVVLIFPFELVQHVAYYSYLFFALSAIYVNKKTSFFTYLICGLYLYSMPHLLSLAIYGENEIFFFTENQRMYNAPSNTSFILRYLNLMIGIFALFSLNFGFLRDVNYQIKNVKRIDFRPVSIVLFGLIFYFYTGIDFTELRDEYILTQEFSLIFGLVYWLSGILFYEVFVEQRAYQNCLSLYLLLTVLVMIMVLGVRQIPVWLSIAFFFGHLLRGKLNTRKIDKKIVSRAPLLGATMYFILLFVLQYRFRKSFDFDISPRAIIFPITAESSLTFASFYHAVHEVSSDLIVHWAWLTDYFVMLVPSQLWLSKYEFLALEKMHQALDITPYGTYYLPATLYVSSNGILSFIIEVISYAIILSFVWKILKKSVYYLFYAPLFLSFVVMYPVRGTFHGGFKIFTYFVVFLILLQAYKILFKSENRVIRGY